MNFCYLYNLAQFFLIFIGIKTADLLLLNPFELNTLTCTRKPIYVFSASLSEYAKNVHFNFCLGY